MSTNGPPPMPTCDSSRPCGLCAGCVDDSLQRAHVEVERAVIDGEAAAVGVRPLHPAAVRLGRTPAEVERDLQREATQIKRDPARPEYDGIVEHLNALSACALIPAPTPTEVDLRRSLIGEQQRRLELTDALHDALEYLSLVAEAPTRPQRRALEQRARARLVPVLEDV
jgi:hypothetical protein